ncbi:hypothetical protein Tco_1533911 [Tanacetum coccineum]
MSTYSYAGVQSWGSSPCLLAQSNFVQEKVQQEKLKAVKARLNFEEVSQHSESGTPNRRRDLKKRLGSRHVHSMSESPEPRHDHSESPRKRDPERKMVAKAGVVGGVIPTGSETREKSTTIRLLERFKASVVPKTSSRRMEALSESEGSAGGHWKSKPKRQKSSVEDDMSQPWVCKQTDTFPSRIRYFDFPKTRMPSHIKQRDEESTKEFVRRIINPELIKRLHDKISKSVDEMMRVTTTFLRGEVAASNREWKKSFPSWKQQEAGQKQNFKKGGFRSQQRPERKHEKDKPLAILMVQPWQRVAKQRITQTFSPELVTSFPTLGDEDGMEGPKINEAEMGGHFVYCMYVDGGSSSEILYEHCFNRFRPKVRNQMIPETTLLVGFSGEIIWP